jgi:opacity protein-like surface antigen
MPEEVRVNVREVPTMRLAIPIVVALLLFAGLAQAATVPTMKGDKAMVFMFHGFDDLGLGAYGSRYCFTPAEYDDYRDMDQYDTYGFGGGFGMRYYFADYMAIRAGLNFAMCSGTDKPDSYADDDQPDDEYSWQEIGVTLVFEKHLEGCGSSVSPYIGAGGGFSMLSVEDKCADWWMDGDDVEWGQDVKTVDATAFEFFAVAGFEWAFTDCMTLGGEYQLGFTSVSGEYEKDYANPDMDENYKTGEDSGSCIGFGTASVFLSVYW